MREKPPWNWKKVEATAARCGDVHGTLVVWSILVALLIPASADQMKWLPPTMRVALFVEEFAWLLLPAVIIALLPWRPVRWFCSLSVALMIFASWGAFQATGRYASVATLRFFLIVPTQSIQHAEQLSPNLGGTYLLLILSGGIAVLLGTLPRRLGIVKPGRSLVVLALIALAGGLWLMRATSSFAASTKPIDDLSTGVSYPTAVLWDETEHHASGPATTFFRSIITVVASHHAPPPLSPFVSVASVARTAAAQQTPKHRWNVLVIVVESMRRDVLFATPTPVIMPTAEAIAQQALRFTDSYTTASQTNLAAPVPLSGQYPLRQPSMGPYPKQITWPRVMLYDVLKPLGWRTAIFSSQNEEWWGMKRLLDSPGLDTLFHAESYSGNTYLPKGDIGFSRFVRKAKKSGKIDDFDTATEAIDWLSQDATTPFVLAVNFQDSHLPYAVPAGTPRRFGVAPASFPILFGRYPEDSVAVVRNDYHNALAYVDAQIARIQAALIKDGRWDSTIVVITGDHGQAFFEHRVAAHANGLWQEQIQVPLILKIPGSHAGDDARAASLLDVAPSIVDALGLTEESAWQGVSLLTAEPAPNRLRFFMVQTPLAHQIGMISGQWKIVLDLERGSAQLFDVKSDPGEHHDLSAGEVVLTKQLAGILRSWQHEQLSYYNSPQAQQTLYPPRLTPTSLVLSAPIGSR